jgi:hypothetical protein
MQGQDLNKCTANIEKLICQLLISAYFYSSIKLIKNIFIIVISIKAKPFSTIIKDYHMTFFISDPLSALGSDISARGPVASRVDIRTKS